jgi:hypothetical protein
MSWVHRTVIVTAADQALAQSLTAGIAGPSGVGMFTTALSHTGAAPATHYISSGLIYPSFAALMSDANQMYAAAQAAVPPVAVTLAQCQTLVADSVVQDADAEGPFATLTRLGLQMLQVAA